MKHISLFHYLLLFISFHILSIPYEEIITLEYSSPLPSFESLLPKHPQEGFYENTLLVTSLGYKEIENIIPGNIVIDCKSECKKVIATTRIFADKYIKLLIDNTTLYTGCDQIYYTYPDYHQIRAKDIKKGDALVATDNKYCLVTDTQLINKYSLLYYVTIEDHIFCISEKNLCVHNAQVLINGLTGIPLGYITITNPIIATIGATLALSLIAHKAYETYGLTYQEGESHTLPTDVLYAERYYYLERFNALKALYQELIDIKNGLEAIEGLRNNNTFTHQFLKQITTQNSYTCNPLLNISVENEITLSDSQKNNLRIMREHEFEYLEKEIISLQYTLAFHINELIDRLHTAHNEYNKAQKEVNQAADAWNKHRDCMNNAIALEVYRITLLDDHLLSDFNQKLNEVKMVAQYYNSCVNTLCIKQSSNIAELFQKITPIITEYDEWITKQRTRIDKNIFGIEKYFAINTVSITQIKQEIKNQLEKSRNDLNLRSIAEAKDELEALVVAGNPKNPKKNDDDNIADNDIDDKKEYFNKKYTKEELSKIAKDMGFEKTNYRSNGQPIFRKGNRYISPDIDSHNGGIWKMADSVKNLGGKATRMGTYDVFLNWIGK